MGISIELDPTLADLEPLPWALSQLRRAVEEDTRSARVTIEIADIGVAGAESFRLSRDGVQFAIEAPDPHGLAYGITELAERLEFSDDDNLALIVREIELHSPATPVRAILRSFSSDVLDLSWFRDRDFWTGYLDELATQRINRLHLAFGMQYNFSHDINVRDNYLCFAYPFLVQVPGWDVGVSGVGERERDKNLKALRFASDEAKRRGISFQLGLWNHAAQPELQDSPQLRYPVRGLPDNQVGEYSALALQILLEKCPSIEGVTFRVHYEGGVPERGHGAFWSRVMGAVREVDRPVDIDMHAKGVDAELLNAAHSAGARVSLSPKYWAEHQGLPYHQARVRDLERARPMNDDALAGVTQNTRRFTRYGYGDFLGLEREHEVIFRVWPGTQRFLLWADPGIFAGYGRWSTIGGSLGAELCEPLTFRGRKGSGEGPRDLYVDPELHRAPTQDWQKYRYTYRLWGRLLYEPDGDAEQWRRYLRREYGAAAPAVEDALAAAGRILPLVTVAFGLSASNNFYWPEGYTNLPMFHGDEPGLYDFDTPAPYTWTAASPFDPEMFESTDTFVDELLADRTSDRFTPIDTAAALDKLITRTETAIAAAEGAPTTPQLREALIDARILAGLGRMFAERIRAGVHVAIFNRTLEPAQLHRAMVFLRRSRDALATVVDIAAPVYIEDLAFGDRTTERGGWRSRVSQLDAELAMITAKLADLGGGNPSRLIPLPSARLGMTQGIEVAAAAGYEPGADVSITIAHLTPSSTVRLHHRPLDQSAVWQVTETVADNSGAARVVIPGNSTDSPFPLMWYLTVDVGHGPAAYPGLGDDLCGQPYIVMSPNGAQRVDPNQARRRSAIPTSP